MMKRMLALLLCALLAVLPAAAEAPDGAPEAGGDTYAGDGAPNAGGDTYSENGAPKDGDLAGEDLTLEVGGERVRLIYDSSPLYSFVQGGLVQASYYAYGADGDTMYLLYIVFPESAMPGMVITPEYAALTGQEGSVSLIVSSREREQYYFSSVMAGQVYPADSTFSIAIDRVDAADGGTFYAGKLSATLVSVDPLSGGDDARLTIPETDFRFTIGGYQNPGASPNATPIPGDMRKV